MADAFQKHMLSPGQESQCRRNLFMRRQTTHLRISLQEQHRTANRWQEHVRIVALIHPSLIKDGGEDFRVQMLQVLCPQARHLFLVAQPSERAQRGDIPCRSLRSWRRTPLMRSAGTARLMNASECILEDASMR
jgi:hypothetical protein